MADPYAYSKSMTIREADLIGMQVPDGELSNLERDAVDAARYRFLRDCRQAYLSEAVSDSGRVLVGAELDAAIDSEMEDEQEASEISQRLNAGI